MKTSLTIFALIVCSAVVSAQLVPVPETFEAYKSLIENDHTGGNTTDYNFEWMQDLQYPDDGTELYDMAGKQVITEQNDVNSQINTSALDAGIYIYRIPGGRQEVTGKRRKE